eukprot:9331825-Pyramimonas_sp.AAC.2
MCGRVPGIGVAVQQHPFGSAQGWFRGQARSGGGRRYLGRKRFQHAHPDSTPAGYSFPEPLWRGCAHQRTSGVVPHFAPLGVHAVLHHAQTLHACMSQERLTLIYNRNTKHAKDEFRIGPVRVFAQRASHAHCDTSQRNWLIDKEEL